jgi:hypothetical protein
VAAHRANIMQALRINKTAELIATPFATAWQGSRKLYFCVAWASIFSMTMALEPPRL